MELKEWKEAKIVIEGTELTFAQSMTVRVAIGAFQRILSDEEYRKALGEIGDNYQARLVEIQNLIMKGAR